MGGQIHAVEDGTGFTAGQVLGILTELIPTNEDALPPAWSKPMLARTPHGSFTFEVAAIVIENGEPAVLSLREVDRTGGHDDELRRRIDEAVNARLQYAEQTEGHKIPMHIAADISQLIVETT